jgi:hypothetical protein
MFCYSNFDLSVVRNPQVELLNNYWIVESIC